MWISQDDQDVGIIGDRAGQLGKSGEYWMGKRISGLDRKFRATRWWSSPVSIKARVSCSLMNKL
jgi:hypothetical protein